MAEKSRYKSKIFNFDFELGTMRASESYASRLAAVQDGCIHAASQPACFAENLQPTPRSTSDSYYLICLWNNIFPTQPCKPLITRSKQTNKYNIWMDAVPWNSPVSADIFHFWERHLHERTKPRVCARLQERDDESERFIARLNAECIKI